MGKSNQPETKIINNPHKSSCVCSWECDNCYMGLIVNPDKNYSTVSKRPFVKCPNCDSNYNTRFSVKLCPNYIRQNCKLEHCSAEEEEQYDKSLNLEKNREEPPFRKKNWQCTYEGVTQNCSIMG